MILKGFKQEIKAAVAIVFDNDNNLLLGMSVGQNDERDGKWVFPGGGVDGNEYPLQSAIRETYEEAGIIAHPLRLPMIVHPTKPFVAFFVLKTNDKKPKLTPNNEFSQMKWFELSKLPKEILSLNLDVLKMIK